MNNEDAKKLIRMAKATAKKRGFPQDADDFAQEFVIVKFKDSSQSLQQAFTEYLRRNYGDTRNASGRARSSTWLGKRLDEKLSSETEDTLLDLQRSPEPDTEPPRIFIPFHITENQLDIFLRVASSDKFANEITEEVGLTESRVSQIRTHVIKAIKDEIEIQELYERYGWDKEFSKLRLYWICI